VASHKRARLGIRMSIDKKSIERRASKLHLGTVGGKLIHSVLAGAGAPALGDC